MSSGIEPALFQKILSGKKAKLVPLHPGLAGPLWDAVNVARQDLKRRFSWVSSVNSLDDEKAFIDRSQEEMKQWLSLVLGITEPKSQLFSGVASLSEIVAGETSKARLSVWVRSERQGRGLATESGKLLAEHAFKTMALHRLYARIDPANRAARKTLQKIGFRYEGCLRDDKRLNGRWIHQECWGILKSEWKK